MTHDSQPELGDVPVPEFVLAVAGMMAARAAVCIGQSSPDLGGARLCIDVLRVMVAEVSERLGADAKRHLEALAGDLQLAYARASARPGGGSE